MNNLNQWNNDSVIDRGQSSGSASMSKSFMANVFSYMFAALSVSGVVAYLFGTEVSFLQYIINFETGSPTILFWIAAFAPLGLVFLMGARINKMQASTMLIVFIVFSVLMGISLSTIFLTYTMSSIASVFFITAGTFGVMAFLGYTTKTDLSKMGSLLFMALIGIIIASVVNWFMNSAALDYLISIGGVVIFTGLTAYDTQKLKRIGAEVGTGNQAASKMAMWGALSLYLDFVNLFLFLLRLLGNRD